MALDTVVVTEAAGLVGTAIRGALREMATRLVLVDRRPLIPEAPGEEVRQAVLDSPETVAGIVAGAGFFVDALTRKDAGFRTLYAVSANTRRFWELSEGYQPQDDAEAYAGTLGGTEGPALQGGAYADPAYTLRHLT
ncbi:hypothetical protein [Nonomuraea sp. NPDC003804]|uniref:hypothetical protein n=1 Tax=Nonomuraea sp. NPDC003804 TaxID=3154547 RepID=UPI0033A1838B